jgi:aryl-alcohol dehydrogenase-like predicted oxidoreductase
MFEKNVGRQGLKVSAMGLGCMGMSDFYGPADESESLATLDRALELGVRFWDTADAYGPFTNEELLGRALRGRRSSVVLATKFGIQRLGSPVQRAISGRPEYVRKACEASLQRLQTDYIDLYYQHRVDPTVPIEETVGAMSDLVKEGKVRFIGLSEAAPTTLRRAHAIHPISALQSEYSLWSRELEDEMFPLLRELGIGLVAYSPLGRGFLTGEFRSLSELSENDYRRHSPRFQGDNFAKNLAVVDAIQAMAQSRQVSASQLALSWVVAQADFIIPIPGTKRRANLESNVSAMQLAWSRAELDAIESVAPKGFAQGNRYPEVLLKAVNI